MAHRADGLNDIFEHNVTVRETLQAGNIVVTGKIFIGPDTYLIYENGKLCVYVAGVKRMSWG